MDGSDSESLTFLGNNLLLLGGLLLLIFIYLVILIRKRWREGFLHTNEIEKERKRKEQEANKH
jgi:hypothetical protein